MKSSSTYRTTAAYRYGYEKARRSIAETPSNSAPVYLWVILGLTLCYLLVEVPFAAYLVELLGRKSGSETMERVETVGRIISGFALALFIWGIQIGRMVKRYRSVLAIVVHCAISGAIVVPGVYYGERLLIDVLVLNSDYTLRQQAARSVAARDELFAAEPKFRGLDVPEDAQSNGQWSAFRGLFPLVSLLDPDILARTGKPAEQVVVPAIRENLPSLGQFRTEMIPALLEGAEKRFEGYKGAVDGYHRGMERLDDRIGDGWDRHVRNMRAHNMHTRQVSASTIRQVVRDVQRYGVPVPDNWDPTDKATFYRVARRENDGSVIDGYLDALEWIMGTRVSVAVGHENFESFLKDDGVQKAMLHDLGLDSASSSITESMTAGQVSSLHERYTESAVERLTGAYLHNGYALQHYQEFADVGEAAARALIVPVFALGLSLLGAVGHVIKFSNYALAIVCHSRKSRLGLSKHIKGNGRFRLAIVVAGISALLVTTYTPATQIVGSPYYREVVSGNMTSTFGPMIEKGLEWTISFQAILQPAGHVARLAGLFSPIEAYINSAIAADEDISESSERPNDAPFPMPRLNRGELLQEDIPLPRPRPNIG